MKYTKSLQIQPTFLHGLPMWKNTTRSFDLGTQENRNNLFFFEPLRLERSGREIFSLGKRNFVKPAHSPEERLRKCSASPSETRGKHGSDRCPLHYLEGCVASRRGYLRIVVPQYLRFLSHRYLEAPQSLRSATGAQTEEAEQDSRPRLKRPLQQTENRTFPYRPATLHQTPLRPAGKIRDSHRYRQRLRSEDQLHKQQTPRRQPSAQAMLMKGS